MDETIRKAWVDELRSGRWHQIWGRLMASETARCATGVLCEAIPAVTQGSRYFIYKGQAMTSKITHTLAKELGISQGLYIWVQKEDMPGWLGPKPVGWADRGDFIEASIFELNDKLCYSFDRIADLVEVGYFPTGLEQWTGTRSSSRETGTAGPNGNRPLFGQLES